MTDAAATKNGSVSDSDSPPELADWWVRGVRKVAALVAGLLLAARVIPILVGFLKLAT